MCPICLLRNEMNCLSCLLASGALTQRHSQYDEVDFCPSNASCGALWKCIQAENSPVILEKGKDEPNQ